MTRVEAEELLITAIMSGKDKVAIKMSLAECQVFRVLIGRALKEMEQKNRSLWLRVREYGIEYRDPYCIIRKRDDNRYPMFAMDEEGKLEKLEVKDEMQSS